VALSSDAVVTRAVVATELPSGAFATTTNESQVEVPATAEVAGVAPTNVHDVVVVVQTMIAPLANVSVPV
jgi:hypothetical protein